VRLNQRSSKEEESELKMGGGGGGGGEGGAGVRKKNFSFSNTGKEKLLSPRKEANFHKSISDHPSIDATLLLYSQTKTACVKPLTLLSR